MHEGTQIHASEVSLPEGSLLVTDPQTLVLSVVLPKKAAAEETETTEASGGDAGAAEAAAEEAPAEAAPAEDSSGEE